MRYVQMFVLPFFLLSALSANAGSEGGNGGIGAVCRNPDGSIRDVVLLDLVEADFDGITIVRPLGSPDAYLKHANRLLENMPLAKSRFESALKRVKSEVQLKDKKFALPDPRDFNPRASLKGCPFEVIGLYDDGEQKLAVDSEIFAKMSPIQKEAFFFHEAAYWVTRRFGAQTSDLSRRIVGQLFAQKTDQAKLWDLLHAPKSFGLRIACYGKSPIGKTLLTPEEGYATSFETFGTIRKINAQIDPIDQGIAVSVVCYNNSAAEKIHCSLAIGTRDASYPASQIATTEGILPQFDDIVFGPDALGIGLRVNYWSDGERRQEFVFCGLR